MTVEIRPDGTVGAVAHPDEDGPILEDLGTVVESRRLGRVEPARPLPRALFRLLRTVLGRSARVRALTRRLPGPWVVVLPDGTRLGPFPDRAAAVAAEEAAALARGAPWRW